MEKNEAFRKQVLNRLYGLPDPTESADQESDDVKPEEAKEANTDEKEKEEEEEDKPVKADETQDESEKETSPKKVDTENTEVADKSEKDKDAVHSDHSNSNGDSGALANNSGSSKSITTHTTPTTTTSHLYSVLMAPLDGHSLYRDHAVRSGADHDTDTGPRKRTRLDNSSSDVKSEHTPEGADHIDTKASTNTNSSVVGMDLTKNQKKKLKKKKRKHLLNRLEVQRAKEFIYSSENEQYSVEKLRTMIEDVTEFLDAIWDVYCSEARLKGESVEEDGYRVAAVLKCLSASGEGSWGDLQLLSRAKSVLVLRSKNLAASTISRVENELGYDTDIRNFIVRMLKFWMNEIVTKG